MEKIDMKLRDDCSLPMIPIALSAPDGIDALLSERSVKGVNLKGEECMGTMIFITAHPNFVRKNWDALRGLQGTVIE